MRGSPKQELSRKLTRKNHGNQTPDISDMNIDYEDDENLPEKETPGITDTPAFADKESHNIFGIKKEEDEEPAAQSEEKKTYDDDDDEGASEQSEFNGYDEYDSDKDSKEKEKKAEEMDKSDLKAKKEEAIIQAKQKKTLLY